MTEQPRSSEHRDQSGSAPVPEDLLDLYFNEMGQHELLTAEQEVSLAQTIEAGTEAVAKLEQCEVEEQVISPESRQALEEAIVAGEKAKDRFTKSNLRLVVGMAAKYSRRSQLGLDELIQEGNLGLIRAVEKFDWRKGYKFSTYATWWIRQAIQRGIAANERTIRLPVALHDAVVKTRAARARLEGEGGEEAISIQALATATKLTPHRVKRAMEVERLTVTSLDRQIGDDRDSSTFGDFNASEESTVAEDVFRMVRTEALSHALSTMDEYTQHVLTKRFGLDGQPAMTLEALAKDRGVSREAIRKIEVKGLIKLREKYPHLKDLIDLAS